MHKSFSQKITARCLVAGAHRRWRCYSSKRITSAWLSLRPEYTNYHYTNLNTPITVVQTLTACNFVAIKDCYMTNAMYWEI